MDSNHIFLKSFFLPYSYKRCIHCKKKKFFKLVYRCKSCKAIIHEKCHKHSQQQTEKIISTEIEKNQTTQEQETAIINVLQANVTDLIGNECKPETQNDEKKSNLPILSHENFLKKTEKDIPIINPTKETESTQNSLDYNIKETTSTIKKIDTSCLVPLTNDRPIVRNVSSRLPNMNMTDQMAVNQNRSLIEKYGILLADINFDAVKTCNDPKILKRIIKILESGEEGFYPALLRETETRLRQIKPDASILNRKLCFAQKSSEISVNEDYGDELNDVANWIKKSNQQEKELSSVRKTSKSFMNGHSELPVRRSIDLTSMFNSEKPEQELSMHKKTSVKHEPLEASYSKWDKYDPDVEIMKLDNKEKIDKLQAHKKKNINSNCLSVGLNDSKSFNDRVKSVKNYVETMSKCDTFKPQDSAMREKELGNECFKSNDYEEAIFHYNTSINIHSTPEARNNRAMSFIKLKKHEKALDDLREVIESDSKNIKAHFRRGSCYKAISMYCLALRSFESTLKYDCNNVNALNSVKELRNTIKNIDRKKLIKVREITRHYDGSVWDIEDIFYVSYMELSELVKNKIEHVYEANPIGCIAHCVCDLCPWHEWLQRHKKWGRHKMFKNEVPKKRWQFLTPDIVPKLLSTSLTLETQKPKRLNVTEINSAKINGHHNSTKICNNEINSTKMNGHYNSTNMNGHEINEIDKSSCKNCDDKINMKPVSNVQQFLQTWKIASQKNNYELYHKLLRSIKPNDLPRVIGSNLDEDIMSKFLEILNQKFDRNCELDLIVEYLTAMTKVNRFNLIVKMLDNKVKEDVQPLIDCVHRYKNNNLFSSLL